MTVLHRFYLVILASNTIKQNIVFKNCVNLAWSMESVVWNSIPSLGFTSKNDINKHVWYSILSLVFNPNVGYNHKFGIGSEFPR